MTQGVSFRYNGLHQTSQPPQPKQKGPLKT